MSSIAIAIRGLTDSQLEEFIELWIETRSSRYVRVERMAGSGDKGRDVVGFLTANGHEGDWDLFQCKRKNPGKTLSVPEAMGELGKVFHHHVDGAYRTLPVAYVFVAPSGVAGALRDLILNPSTVGPRLIAGWDKECAPRITAKRRIPLSPAIRAAIEGFDFSRVTYLDEPGIAKQQSAQPALSKILNLLPKEAPPGETPDAVQPHEAGYVAQLREVYGEFSGQEFKTVDDVLAHPRHGEHFSHQRTRFFEAAAFKAFHRDNTAPGLLKTFIGDVYNGVFEVQRADHTSLLNRVDAVMTHAVTASIAVGGLPTRAPVRQGICHHLVNEGKLKWTR